jgi:hypothetical protein
MCIGCHGWQGPEVVKGGSATCVVPRVDARCGTCTDGRKPARGRMAAAPRRRVGARGRYFAVRVPVMFGWTVQMKP